MEKRYKFYVWRRNDGYVAATASAMPQDYTSHKGDLVTYTFLGGFDLWADAYNFIDEERKKA